MSNNTSIPTINVSQQQQQQHAAIVASNRIISKKPNSIFIVPQQTSTTTSISPLLASSSSGTNTSTDKQQVQNKNRITVIPINLPSQFKILNNSNNVNSPTSLNCPTKKIIINASNNNNNSNNTTVMPQATIITKSLNQNMTSIGGGGATSVNNNNKVHVVKIINTPSCTTTTVGHTIAQAAMSTSYNPSQTTSTTTTTINNENIMSPLKMHTYQVNRATMPLNPSKSVYIPQGHQNHHHQTPTVIHKICNGGGTQLSADSLIKINNYRSNTNVNMTSSSSSSSVNNGNNNNYSSSSSTNNRQNGGNYYSCAVVDTTANNDEDDLVCDNAESMLDVDAIKLIYNSLQTQNTDNQQQSQQQSIPNTSKLKSVMNDNHSCLNLNSTQMTSNMTPTTMSTATTSNNSGSNNNRKPCNCTKSQCLKLYCDCFAIGSFCYDCNCINCWNTLEHEDERNKAIKLVLERNPSAFQSKIGKFTYTASTAIKSPTRVANEAQMDQVDLDIQNRHIKGCNCKKSNCLKRYCECYLAKIQCSTLCKCVGCKNCDDTTKSLLQLANAAEMRKQQMISYLRNTFNSTAFSSSIGNTFAHHKNSPTTSAPTNLPGYPSKNSKYEDFNQLKTYSFITSEVADATCQCLIAQAEECEQQNLDEIETERYVLEEFGRCLIEIIESAENNNICFNNNSKK